ncbi:MAG TPA: hypothetical protein PKA51_04060, partial [Kiritimatiellia bacterium]|nr:hypothetical protein [Kiritimatiellia bacterium]
MMLVAGCWLLVTGCWLLGVGGRAHHHLCDPEEVLWFAGGRGPYPAAGGIMSGGTAASPSEKYNRQTER